MEKQFWNLNLDEKNKQDLQKWIDEDKMVGIVNEENGGIIGYINKGHINKILKKLNKMEEKLICDLCLGNRYQDIKEDETSERERGICYNCMKKGNWYKIGFELNLSSINEGKQKVYGDSDYIEEQAKDEPPRERKEDNTNKTPKVE